MALEVDTGAVLIAGLPFVAGWVIVAGDGFTVEVAGVSPGAEGSTEAGLVATVAVFETIPEDWTMSLDWPLPASSSPQMPLLHGFVEQQPVKGPLAHT